ncbi:HpcH/HpaI aldolase family protein [Allonocardiopsis opalescens]|uniref:4-hydroxy-2-oxoheptanedioate aldolase n=1 Tax=Allonocardiopsis opalescens TaxID=1144618 RepID=A0A2T0Q786_9ACTN|nr:aldolase/citrate lyase family protein [Allonocardiopsis opalescens]PRX99700.1 4-hydroxy-2-oxoheptanedioate aldolase [Allonocardiopsis opalescens]
MTAAEFARRIRNREKAIGYWALLDAPVAVERLARLGYDYIALDAQHGLFGYSGMLNNLLAIDAGGASVGLVRVESNDAAPIGRALDAGAGGVIVPLIDTAEDAAAAVAATRYPPHGIRSYGPMRSMLRVGPKPAEADAATLVLAMIETRRGLENVEAICATPGLDGIYLGPSDLRLAVGGATSTDPAVDEVFDAAVLRVRKAAEAAGIAAGIHTPAGEVAARRLAEGFTFATVASDLVHLDQAAAAHLDAARGGAA